MPSRYIIYREVRDDSHPAGWEEIAKCGSLAKAITFSDKYEKDRGWLYADNNSDREYILIESTSQ